VQVEGVMVPESGQICMLYHEWIMSFKSGLILPRSSSSFAYRISSSDCSATALIVQPDVKPYDSSVSSPYVFIVTWSAVESSIKCGAVFIIYATYSMNSFTVVVLCARTLRFDWKVET